MQGYIQRQILMIGYFGSGILIKKSIKKYGKKNHTKEILCHASSREELSSLEEAYVNASLLLDDKCLNLKTGGETSGSMFGMKHTKSSRDKIANGHLGKKHDDATKYDDATEQ